MPTGKVRARSNGSIARPWLQRAVGTEDVSRAVRFLLETPSITGQIIALDSG
jgi:hypothetical protein